MSMVRAWPVVLVLGLLSACKEAVDEGTLDDDGDGLTNDEEAALGSNPASADSDADGLLDGEEQAAGTDPNKADTDGDTYLDLDEMNESTDPLDPESRIYTGYWPYYAGKEELLQNGLDGETFKLNKQFARIQAVDQFGETVDLYDFYNLDGRPLMFDVSAEWCGPCNEVAAFLDGSDQMFGIDVDPGFIELRTAINQGEMYWITVLSESNGYDTADVQTCERWYDAYPKDQIPVLADEEWDDFYDGEIDSITEYIDLVGWPTLILMDGELKPKTTSDTSYVDSLCLACEMLGISTDAYWCP